jgi:hypothetical protein
MPKTGCFFSDDLDVYVDTSDGTNDDLRMHEYCGRILACIKLSKGKKFIFFKSAYSSIWSKKIEAIADQNNGKVVPFFKWSFNPNFYSHTSKNLDSLRSCPRSLDYDIGLFADFNKKYSYPKPSSSDKRISYNDHGKFGIEGTSPNTGEYIIESRPDLLKKLSGTNFRTLHGNYKYSEYIKASMSCASVLNPPGIGEYTSRMMDQLAIGNLLVLRKNSYDNGNSWKDYIPEVDFSNESWVEDYQDILDNSDLWKEKGLYYYENLWSSKAIYDYFLDQIYKEI